MRFYLTVSFVALGISRNVLAHPSLHQRESSGGVDIVLPPNLSNQTGLQQIPGESLSVEEALYL
jgi:hypothetical protein